MLCKDCWNFLAGQALALSGDNRDEDSNFIQILKLRAKDIPQLAYWMKRKQNKFMSHDIQNEIIQTMENQMTRYITANIWNNFYSIICAEYRDISKKNSYRFAYVELINFLLCTNNF